MDWITFGIAVAGFLMSLATWVHTFLSQRRNVGIRITEFRADEKIALFFIHIENKSRLPIAITRIVLISNQEKVEHIKQKNEWIKEIAVAEKEILETAKLMAKDFSGFSESVLLAISLCGKDDISLFFDVITSLNLNSKSEKMVRDLSISTSNGKTLSYSYWARLTCEKLMSQKNVMLQKVSLRKRVAIQAGRLFLHLKQRR